MASKAYKKEAHQTQEPEEEEVKVDELFEGLVASSDDE